MDEYDNTPKTILKPRNEGETIKKAQVVMRRRDRNLQANADRARKIQQAKYEKKEYKKGSIRIKRAEDFAREFRLREKCKSRVKTSQKRVKHKRAARAKVILVARNGRASGCKMVYKTLKSFGLVKKSSMVFLPNDAETARKLDLARPNLFWGRCSHKTVLNLIQKRAMFKQSADSEEKIALSDNAIIEKHFGDQGILCTEDLVDVLFTHGPKFNDVSEKLWAFEIGESRSANGMVRENQHLMGPQKDDMDTHVAKLIGL